MGLGQLRTRLDKTGLWLCEHLLCITTQVERNCHPRFVRTCFDEPKRKGHQEGQPTLSLLLSPAGSLMDGSAFRPLYVQPINRTVGVQGDHNGKVSS